MLTRLFYGTRLFSWYGLLIVVGGIGCVSGDFSQTHTITNNSGAGSFYHGQLPTRLIDMHKVQV